MIMDPAGAPNTSKIKGESRTQAAKRLYEERRLRTKHFQSSDLFGEPSWDILLYLFQGHSQGRGVKIETVSMASRLPTTSALRTLELLENEGLVFAYRDEKDVTQIYLRLSAKGLLEMAAYLDRILQRDGISASIEGRSLNGLEP